MMDRLRCGVIYTDAFSALLTGWWAAEPAAHAERVPSLEFVRCGEGERAGECWVALTWMLVKKLPEHERFTIGGVPLHLSKQSQKGLQHRCLDAREGKLMVVGG